MRSIGVHFLEDLTAEQEEVDRHAPCDYLRHLVKCLVLDLQVCGLPDDLEDDKHKSRS